VWVVWTIAADAAVAPLSGPGSFDPSATTITFEGYPHGTIANALYSGLGVTFSRDDGQPVNIYNWSAIGRVTVSPSNVLATVSFLGASTYVTHLNASFASPMYQVGAWFGNDQGGADFGPDFTSETFSAYGAGGVLLGQVNEACNNNTSVDQFIGLQSDQPIWSVRFQNMSSAGTPSTHFAVIIDNFEFSAVPEPSPLALIGLGLLNLIWLGKGLRVTPKSRSI
jgi:hypothetical protein